MATKDLKNAIKGSTNRAKVQEQEPVVKEVVGIEEQAPLKFKLANKKEDKRQRKSFPLYMENFKIKELDKVCNRTGYNRNELINLMIDFCLDNLDLTGDEE